VLNRWPVRVELPVPTADCDADGRLTDGAVERLFAEARTVYYAECSTLDASTVEVLEITVDPNRGVVGNEGVTISVSVVEVFPDSFTMTARLRPVDPESDDPIAASAWCSLSPGGEVTTAMRDEFIAHVHAARYMH
jgi:acyl-CoA thioesterase FadM